MTEREKIISELQSALEWCQPEDNPNGSIAVKIWAARNAIIMLKELEPKPVKVYDESFYFCPKCNHQFYGYYKRPNYCDRCGQAVKWNEP